MSRWIFAFALTISAPLIAVTPLSHEQVVQRERSARIERLVQPDGWLSLVGLHWFEPGTHRVGRAADNDIVLAVGPDRLGTLTSSEAGIRLALAEGVDARIGEQPVSGEIELQPDSAETPTRLLLEDGQGVLQVIERGGRFGLRVRDSHAKTRTAFAGLVYFPIDESWRITAHFEAHPPGQTIEIANVLGQLEPMANPGRVRFSREGRDFSLEAVDEGDGRLFLIFGDRTNGRLTYGAGRFLYADPAVDGRTVLDFNLAYNPPCAFTEFSTCPLPPPGNRLDLAVTSGERRYEPESR